MPQRLIAALGFTTMTSRNQGKERQARARAAMAARDAENKPKFLTVVGGDSWLAVLHEIESFVIGRLRKSEERVRRYGSLYPGAVAILNTGTMLRSPATAQELHEFEERFQITIPPSYRAFLEASNGLRLPVDGKFLSSGEVQSYREIDLVGADLMEEFAEDFEEDDLDPPDDQYFQYSSRENAQLIRPRYARTALALNGPDGEYCHVGKIMGWALLVREVSFSNGEFEIWQQAFEEQYRFASFSDYFSAVRHVICESVVHL